MLSLSWVCVGTYDWGEPAVSYKWTGWVWEIPVEVQDCRKITNHFRTYPNLIKENRMMSTCNRLDLQTLGSQPIMPKNLPNHWLVLCRWCLQWNMMKLSWILCSLNVHACIYNIKSSMTIGRNDSPPWTYKCRNHNCNLNPVTLTLC